MIKTKISMLFFVCFVFAYAQTPPPFEKDIQREEQKKIFEHFEKSEQQAPLRFNVQTPALLPVILKEQCMVITKITYENVTLLSPEEIKNVTQKYLNQCALEATFKNLFNELSTLYLNKGYVTSRVYMKE